MNRTKRAKLNVMVTLITYFVQLFPSMIVRVVFIQKLGNDYLGLNGVLTSTLSMLSLVDLGLDSVFVYTLFQPLKEKDAKKVTAVMRLYRNTFRWIAIIVTVLGVILVAFLPEIIGNAGMKLPDVYTIYFLFLANTVSSYLLGYNRSVLNANQQGYIANGVTSLSFVVVNMAQLISLMIFKNPVLYVSIQLMGTIVSNVIITVIARHEFPFLKVTDRVLLDSSEKSKIFKNAVGGFSSKIGSLIVFGSDNIILSLFTNLATVGIYSNYSVITNAIQTILQKVSSALTPSVGYLGVERDSEKNRIVLTEIIFILYTLIAGGYAIYLVVLSPFMRMWVGEKSVFAVHTETLISIVLILQLVRVPFWIYIDAFGLQWVQRWKSIIEAFVNIFFTLLFIGPFKLGVNGVLLGTILSTAMTVSWIEPFVIYKYPLKGNFQGVSELLCKFGLLFGIQTFLGYLGEAYLGGNSLISIMGKVATMLLVSAAMIIIMFGRSNYFWVLKKRLFN